MVRESGWNTVKLKDICDFIGGGTPSKQVENFWCGNIPWISSSDLIESSIWEINITRHITAEAVAKSATHICPRNTVLVVSRVGVGKVAIAPFEVCTSQDFTNLVSKKHDARFLAYCIQNKMKIMAEKTQGTSIKGVTVENIAQMEIELPPQEEQTAIAEALSDIDNLISSQQKLIEKKKAIKQGTMQELLTGKKRLPGFSGKWTNTTLGRCFSKIVGGGTPSRAISEFWNGEIPWATVKDFATFNPYKTQEYISEAGLNHSSSMRIIHLEDSVDKHMEVCRELRKMGITSVEWATSVGEGLEKIETAIQNGAPFDLAISDMHYPIRRGEIADWEAGEYFLKALAERNINLPVIICSTRNYRIPGAYGSVWFSDLSDWEMDLRNLINGLGK